ncbi:hypothetical protein CINF_0294 [Candidatus Campylobacter infans]|uniref:Uncharacterized protein n=1 Tax=Candidatus Campylobacter infans TaxID=2561898 RepID=A0A7H9CGR7_9BACT|nr:hypothetical protein [Candidatus Campylobacter infans]QLI04841.1 hypothetical protein CINF_0294 [Candidatus Campylobacter infans]
MQRALNYEKYFNMTKEQLRASLARATQKEKSKMAEFFIDILGVDKSLNDDDKIYMLDEAPIIKELDMEFAKLPKQEQEKLKAEVKAQMGLK